MQICIDRISYEIKGWEAFWLPFLNTYRTMCVAPEPDFRRLLEDIRELQIAA